MKYTKDKTDSQSFNKDDLFYKEKNKLPMTYAELEALQREKSKELSNQVLRVFGLFAVLAIVVFAVGTFLYPYSLFNLFGKGDHFWECWNNIPFHTGVIYNTTGDVTYFNGNEWLTLSQIYEIAFQPMATAKVNFVALGAWSIVPLCTIGLVGIAVISAYLIAYNIKDLINVIKHFIRRTGFVLSDVADSVNESVESALKDTKTKKKSTSNTKKTTTPKKDSERRVEGDKQDNKDTNEVSLPEINVDELLKDREEKKSAEKIEGGYTSEQLDALLSGESIEDVEKLG